MLIWLFAWVRGLPTGCGAPSADGAEVGIRLPGRNDSYYQADLGVLSAKTEASQGEAPQPVLIVEVLSPSTAERDRGVNVPDYRTIPSVQAILLVASWERRVELRRREGELWTVEDLVGEGVVRLTELGLELPLSALYDGIALDQDQGTASST